MDSTPSTRLKSATIGIEPPSRENKTSFSKTSSKAFAAINGRDFVIPEDVKRSLNPVLNHRVILTPEREMEGMTPENVIEMIVQSVEVPR